MDRPLDQRAPGTLVKVTRVDEHSGDTLTEMGIIPGRQLRVLFTYPLGGPVIVSMGNVKMALARGVARYIWTETVTRYA